MAGARALALAVCSCGGGMQQRGRRQPRQLRWRWAAPLQRQQLREDMRLRRRPLLRTALPHHQQLSCQERYPLVAFGVHGRQRDEGKVVRLRAGDLSCGGLLLLGQAVVGFAGNIVSKK